MSVIAAANDIEKFITRWTASSGNERANFQSFANELCRIIGVEEPEPAKEVGSLNDYTFERKVEFSHLDSSRSTGRIDLYKKHSFIMEAKQSREKGRPKTCPVSSILSNQTTSRADNAAPIAHGISS